jgi:putative transposase
MQHYAGQYYHVYNRGVNRQPIFDSEENYHFLVGVDKDGSLSPFFQRLFNRQQNRTGTLFEGRAKSIIVDESNYVYALVRYIHLNPVVAGLVSTPEDWQFSNYLDWVDARNGDIVDSQFRELFFSSPDEYRSFVLSNIPAALERKISKYYLD